MVGHAFGDDRVGAAARGGAFDSVGGGGVGRPGQSDMGVAGDGG